MREHFNTTLRALFPARQFVIRTYYVRTPGLIRTMLFFYTFCFNVPEFPES